MKTTIAVLSIAVLLLVAPASFLAQDTGKKTVEERLKDLEQRVKVLEEKLAKAEAEVAKEKTEKQFNSMRDSARVSFSKTGRSPTRLTGTANEGGCGVSAEELDSEYVRFDDKLYVAKPARRDTRAAILGEEKGGDKRFGIVVFSWGSGRGEIQWFATRDKLIEANKDVDFGQGFAADKDKPDPWALYRKVGRMWTVKNVITIQGMDPMVSYTQTEVLKADASSATIKYTSLDKDKKPINGMQGTETKIEFANYADDYDPPQKVETTEETIKVEAGEFECTLFNSNGSKTWMSKKYPGLMVKMETSNMTAELVEFKD